MESVTKSKLLRPKKVQIWRNDLRQKKKVITTMFLPNDNAAAEKAAEKELFSKVEAWCVEIIPADIRGEAQVSVQEVQCGDPECSPIDTVITIIFNRYVCSICTTCYVDVCLTSFFLKSLVVVGA